MCGIEGIEHFQYLGLFEHIPCLVRFNLMDKAIASAILQCQIDNHVYDYMVGRSLNFRFDDQSSLFKDPHLKKHLIRMLSGDQDDAVKRIRNENNYFPFVVHETFPNIKLFFGIYPKLKIVHTERDPVDLVYSWYKRGWANRWGLDVKDFSVSIAGPSGPIPWFAYEFKDEYNKMNEIDRIISSLSFILTKSREVYSQLSDEQKQRICTIKFESLLTNTDEVVEKLSKFFCVKIMDDIDIIKSREHLPLSAPEKSCSEKISFIRKNASPSLFEILTQLKEKYKSNESMLF